jgi:hypothetical protein
MRRLLRASGGERGQALMLSVLVISIVFVIGVIVVDFGLWFSERRGAQKDADLSALAAAQPLLALADCPDAALQQAANDRGWEYAQYNGVTDLANAHLPAVDDCAVWTDCWADQGDTTDTIDSYPLDIEHPSRGLFASIFDMAAPEGLGAHARACVGSIVEKDRVMPIGVPFNNPDYERWSRELCYDPDDDGDGLPEPLFGKRCDLSVNDKVSGEASWLRLDNPIPPAPASMDCGVKTEVAVPDLKDEIEQGGANTVCRVAPDGYVCSDADLDRGDGVNWCVKSQTGSPMGPLMASFEALVSGDGGCDVTRDGIDDFEGTVEPTEFGYYDVICESPRLIYLIIVDNYDPTGQSVMPIRAFAAFFVEACYNDRDPEDAVPGTEYPYCDPQGQIGQFNLVGRFVNIVAVGGVGPPVDWTPKRIILDE